MCLFYVFKLYKWYQIAQHIAYIEREVYEGIRETDVPDYENTRSHFKCFYREKKKNCAKLQGYQRPKGHFRFQIKLPLTLLMVLLMNQ